NALIALAEMQSLGLEEAYAILKEEEKRYAAGTEAERRKIDEKRSARDAYAQEEMNRIFGRARDSDDGGLDDEFDDFDSEEDIWNGPDASNLTAKQSALYEKLKVISAQNVRSQCSHDGGAQQLLMQVIEIGSMTGDMSLLVRIWNLFPEKTRKHLDKQYRADMGESFTDRIKEVEEMLSEQMEAEEDFDEEFIRVDNTSGKKLSQQDELELKQTYRKLARKIHPDSQSPKDSESLKKWYSKIWHRVQNAYQHRNLTALKKLDALTLIRMKELRSMTLAEITQSSQWLDEELNELRLEVKDLRKHPAWKFSTKRSYETLIVKIRKDFQRDIEPLLKQIERLSDTHQYLEKIGNLKSRPRKKNSKKKSPKPRTSQGDPRQGSFF
ncbi:MAG: hypothetical protein ABIQ95_00495, partial [Bdellovibrionia bacterium]